MVPHAPSAVDGGGGQGEPEGRHLSADEASAAVLEASRAGDVARVRDLLEAHGDSVDLGWPGTRGGAPNAWSAALARGHLDVVGVLASHPGAAWDPRRAVSDGRSALQLAAWRGHAVMVETLLRHSVGDPDMVEAANALDEGTGMGAVHLATHVEDAELASETLGALVADARVDVNGVDARGMTALHYAAQRPLLMGLGALLRHPRLDAMKGTRTGRTSLEVAAGSGHWEAVELLVRAPGTTRQACARALTAARAGGHVRVQRLLHRPLAPRPRGPMPMGPRVAGGDPGDGGSGGAETPAGASLALWAGTLTLAAVIAGNTLLIPHPGGSRPLRVRKAQQQGAEIQG